MRGACARARRLQDFSPLFFFSLFVFGAHGILLIFEPVHGHALASRAVQRPPLGRIGC